MTLLKPTSPTTSRLSFRAILLAKLFAATTFACEHEAEPVTQSATPCVSGGSMVAKIDTHGNVTWIFSDGLTTKDPEKAIDWCTAAPEHVEHVDTLTKEFTRMVYAQPDPNVEPDPGTKPAERAHFTDIIAPAGDGETDPQGATDEGDSDDETCDSIGEVCAEGRSYEICTQGNRVIYRIDGQPTTLDELVDDCASLRAR